MASSTGLTQSTSGFTVVSYNMHGFGQGCNLLKLICNEMKPAIVFTQEHWLSSITLNNIVKFSSDYCVFASSAMENVITSGILRGRPFGGVAVLVNKQFNNNVKLIHSSERFIIVQLCSLILINVYIPSCSNKYDNESLTATLLCEIDEVLSRCSQYGGIIIGGDFNADLTEDSSMSKLIKDFMSDHDMVICEHQPHSGTDAYTYHHTGLNQYSLIDYFCVSESIFQMVSSCSILDDEPNLSDHLPISISVNCDVNLYKCPATESHRTNSGANKSEFIYTLRWDHADLSQYYYLSLNYLQPVYDALIAWEVNNPVCPLCVDGDSIICKQFINNVYNDVVCRLRTVSTLCIPTIRRNSLKYWWDQELDALKEQSIAAHRQWISMGKPKQGECFETYKRSKYAYKAKIKEKERNAKSCITNSLHDALLDKDQSTFWKVWKSKFGKRNDTPTIIEGCSDQQEIADKFSEYFAATCTVNSPAKDAEFRLRYDTLFQSYQGDCLTSNSMFTVELVDKIISELKLGKAAGVDGLTAEHVKYSHPIIVAILAKLFNLMLIHKYVPDEFGLGLTIPIPKGDFFGKSASYNDFRGITISPVLSKVFESGLLVNFGKYFQTSGQQFGFKKNLSCAHAIYSVRQTVDYFVSNGSTVNICALDLSKAFDKVNVHCLLIKLMQRSIPLQLIVILECWLGKSFVTVRWGSCFSIFVRIRAGVRQGGVLSPVLFSVYIDDVITAIINSRYGCYIHGFCVSVFVYADDIILLASSIVDLQRLVNICVDELDQIDMVLNSNKSVCLRVGCRFMNSCVSIFACNKPLSWVQQLRYLGVYLISGKCFKCCFDIAKNKFYKAANAVFNKVGIYQADVTLSLINSYCLPILLYGLEAVVLSKAECVRLNHPLDMVFSKVFGTFNKGIIRDCYYYMHFLPLTYAIDLRRMLFLCRIMRHQPDNSIAKILLNSVGKDEFCKLADKYGILSTDSFSKIKFKIWNVFVNY